MLNWHGDSFFKTVGHLMPLDGIWSQHDEQHLTWDESECLIYGESRYGSDDRILKHDSVAATALHSWGNVTRACPRGCRKALSRERLWQVEHVATALLLQAQV